MRNYGSKAAFVVGGLLAALTLGTAPAGGFGTVNILGQNAEHEKITRTLGLAATDGPKRDEFQPATLDLLAGKNGKLGAVGAPDNLVDSSIVPVQGLGPGYKHCDDADFLDVPGYPQTRRAARDNLRECIDYYQDLMDRALDDAGRLVGTDGRLNVRETDIDACDFGWKRDGSQPAKCEVLNAFGRALHLAEDFYSHSNWVDDPAPGPTGLTNPPGLGRTDTADFFEFPEVKTPIPDGLLTGCDDSVSKAACTGRVPHSIVAKDSGVINPVTGEATATKSYPRGQVARNFERAVSTARKQARQTWLDLRQEIGKRYGDERGDEIVRAITSDAPWSRCLRVTGDARRALDPPIDRSANRSIRVTVQNSSGERLNCRLATLDSGEWAGGHTSPVPRGSSSVIFAKSNGSSVEGAMTYRIGDDRDDLVTIRFRNPLAGFNKFSCDAPRDFKCVQRGSSSGNEAALTFDVMRG